MSERNVLNLSFIYEFVKLFHSLNECVVRVVRVVRHAQVDILRTKLKTFETSGHWILT